MEEWREVKGYEGLYEVSNLGRVKSLMDCNGQARTLVLKVQKHRCGYQLVFLCKDGKMKGFVVHRLVATTFIPNPDGLPCVNHIDEDKTNNRADNLEWCTAKYNINYGTCIKRRAEKQGKRVYQYTKSGSFVRSYPSTHEAERQTGIGNSHISACARGKHKTARGYIWSFNPPTDITPRSLW